MCRTALVTDPASFPPLALISASQCDRGFERGPVIANVRPARALLPAEPDASLVFLEGGMTNPAKSGQRPTEGPEKAKREKRANQRESERNEAMSVSENCPSSVLYLPLTGQHAASSTGVLWRLTSTVPLCGNFDQDSPYQQSGEPGAVLEAPLAGM